MINFKQFDLLTDEQYIIDFLNSYEPFYYAPAMELTDLTTLTVDKVYELGLDYDINIIMFKWYGGAEEIAMEFIIGNTTYNLYQLTSLLITRIQ